MSNQTKLRRLCSLTLVALQWTVFRVTGSAPQMAERSPVVVAEKPGRRRHGRASCWQEGGATSLPANRGSKSDIGVSVGRSANYGAPNLMGAPTETDARCIS